MTPDIAVAADGWRGTVIVESRAIAGRRIEGHVAISNYRVIALLPEENYGRSRRSMVAHPRQCDAVCLGLLAWTGNRKLNTSHGDSRRITTTLLRGRSKPAAGVRPSSTRSAPKLSAARRPTVGISPAY
jgi:hypothetical protein